MTVGAPGLVCHWLAELSLLSSHPHPHSGCERVNRFCLLVFIGKVKRLTDARKWNVFRWFFNLLART